jgi:F-type H+-transporting ATPase subunit a
MIDGLFATTSLLAEEEQIGWGVFVYLGIVVIVIFGLIAWAKTGLNERVFKKPITQWAEQAYLFIEHLCVSVIGPHGRKYMPFLMTIWLLIFGSNVLGLLLPHAPMADWSLTLALAIIVFVYVQYEGIRQNGPLGHLRHFAGPKLDGIVLVILITPLIFCIEFVSEWVKILSLSLRLYGNVFAGHQTKNTIDALPFVHAFPVVGEILLPLELLVAVVQAFVFVVLTAIYLALVTQHSEEDQEHGAHDEHGSQAHAAAA